MMASLFWFAHPGEFDKLKVAGPTAPDTGRPAPTQACIRKKPWIPFAVIAAGFGVFGASRIAATPQSGFAAWAFLFACACCGSGLNAIRNLSFRPIRWIHRFTIYSGYVATFAAMGAAALYLQVRAASNRMAAVALLAVYLVDSACIFLAKTFTVRRAIKTMPGYQASPKTDDDGRGYW